MPTRSSASAPSRALGLDLPLWQQYLVFLSNALHGDLGRSFVFNEPALRLILQRMPATLELAVRRDAAWRVLIGLPLGLYAGLRPNAPARQDASWRARSSASRCRPSGSG